MRFSAASALLANDSEGSKRYHPRKSAPATTTPSIARRNSLHRTYRRQSEGSYTTVTGGQDDEPARTWQRAAPPDLAQHKHRDLTCRNMPPLRDDSRPNPTAARPLMPTLATKRNVKSPITPRLAAQHAAAGNGTSTPPLAKIAPSPRSILRSPTSNREELTTPAKTFMSSNVTPRSGSRKSRVDSNQTTPSGTPNGSRPPSHVDAGSIGSGGKQHTPFAGFGLGIAGPGNRSRPTSMVGGVTSPGLGITSQSKFSRPDDQADGPMFFHASDAQRSPELRPTPAARKSPVFFYANGQQDETTRPTSQPSPPLSSVSTKSKKSQFFRADGRADEDIPPVPSLPSPSVSAPPQFFQAAPAFRPPSPGKDVNFHLSYRKGASQIIRPPVERPKTVSILPPDTLEARKRPVSGISGQNIAPHKRTSSLSSIESGASARKTSSGFEGTGLTPLQTILQAHSPVSSEPSSAIGSAASPTLELNNEAMAESTSSLPTRERQASLSSPILSLPQSPTKAQNSFQNQLAETIMNARVERKIQDLEISNSSLMAINKSLEKEVRRQNKELRRFRRLSRAGRLSTVSTARSVGTEDEFSGLGGELNALDELTEEEDEEDEEEDEPSSSSDDSSSMDDMSLSPEAIAEREARKLAKDSKRLQLDLAKHRDILVDSQKLNQSLKRCMAWTEMMIKDGRKALEYKAETDDVRGRVLDHDERDGEDAAEEEDADDDEDGPRHSLLSAWTPSPTPMAALEALDGLLGVDTSGLMNAGGTQSNAMPAALNKGDFWGIAGALP